MSLLLKQKLLNYDYKSISKPPTSIGGLSFLGLVKLPFRCLSKPLISTFLLIFLILFSTMGQSALRLTQPPAILNYFASVMPNEANIEVIRFERIGFFRFDENSPTSFRVREGNFADQDSLSGTPTALDVLPAPLDSEGNPFTLNSNLPLVAASAHEYFLNEPVFIIAEGPILPASSFAIRPDGLRFIGVTIALDNGDSFIITLVETELASGDYVGYLQANHPSSDIVIPANSTVSIVYNNVANGQFIPNEDTINAPWFINPTELTAIQNRRLGTILADAQIVPELDLFLSKQALRSTAIIGDFITYELRLENTSNVAVDNIVIEDTLPKGFRLQQDSARLNGELFSDLIISNTGANLTFSVGALSAGEVLNIRYVTEITVRSEIGNAINIAQAKNNSINSNIANATVLIENPFFNDRAFLLGRVLVGACNSENAKPLEGVRIYLEDGTNVITDEQGRWHLEGVLPGNHVLQLDTKTIGARYVLQHCNENTRSAGNAGSRFVDVQGGTLWREDWYLDKVWGTDANIEQQLSSKTLEDGRVEVELALRTGERNYNSITTRFTIPKNLKISSNTTTIDGRAAEDFQKKDAVYEITLKPEGYFSKYTLGFIVEIDSAAVDLNSHLESSIIADTKATSLTSDIYKIRSKNLLEIKGVNKNNSSLVLRPSFSSLSAELTGADKQQFDNAIKTLTSTENIHLNVIGHSDNIPIRYRAGQEFNDNYILSTARAKAVADYFSEKLKIDSSKVSYSGKGADEPVATNLTSVGRAKNRRVEVNVKFSEETGKALVNVIEGYSGINTDNDEKVFRINSEQIESSKDLRNEKPLIGFVNISEGMTFAHKVFSATAVVDEKLKVELTIDGELISNKHIGFKKLDPDTGLVRYTWVGLELDRIGDHTILLQGIGPFGNARFEEKVNVRLSSQIKTIRLDTSSNNNGQVNMADGQTPIKVKLKLLDDSNKLITSGAELTVVSGNLIPLNAQQNSNPLEARSDLIQVDRDGYIEFEPVGNAGTYQVRLAVGDNSSEVFEDIDVVVSPDLRDWILVGFAEGTIGYNTLNGNMNALEDEENKTYTDAETAFFARGKVKGEWLLTMSYDSRKVEGDSPLLQRIDPQAWYVLYGDNIIRGHDAPSTKKLYLRIEKTDFYALFGDYDTGLSVTELSNYQRTFTGAKLEWNSKTASATAFATQTDQAFIRDDIAADGTSGLYRLTQSGIVPGSDEIFIETRDRFTNNIISSEKLTRFIDYSLDIQDGALYFREPVNVQDENFNPQRIVVLYEVESTSEEIVAGGRVALYDENKKVEVGLSLVDDSTQGADGTLGGIDLTWKPNESHTIRAELAGTQQRDVNNVNDDSQASLVDYQYTSEKFDAGIRAEETDGQFGLGNIASDDDDIQKAQINGRYRFNEEASIATDVSHQEVISTGNTRDAAEARLEYKQPEWEVFGGLRHAEDQVADESFESQQLITGGRKQLLDQRLSLSARGETSIGSNENVDYADLLGMGAEYRINNTFSVFAQQDLTWSEQQRSQDSRVGLRSIPWKGGTVTTDVNRTENEFGPRLLAHAGLYQVVEYSSNWSGDFGLDRSQTIREDEVEESVVFDDRRELANGTNNDDYTAASTGLGYRTANWQWTNRVEVRRSDVSDKWNYLSGLRYRLDETDSIAGRVLHFDTKENTGTRNRSTEIDFSYSRRPLSDQLYWLNRSQLIFDQLDSSGEELKGQRAVNNTHINFLPSIGHQVSLQYGARYVQESIDDKNFKGFSDLIGGEYRYDITQKWDVGFRASTLASHNSNIRNNSFGLMFGHSPIKDVWISLGYNFDGFYDKDFENAGTRIKGFVLNFRIKLDQDGAKQLANKIKN